MEEVAAARGKIVLLTDDRGLEDNGHKTFQTIRVPKAHAFISRCCMPCRCSSWPITPAVFMGTDVDQPRNLAKSVTVE